MISSYIRMRRPPNAFPRVYCIVLILLRFYTGRCID